MTDPEPTPPAPQQPAAQPADRPQPVPAGRPADPERGLRAAMSATLVLEAITVLLSIRVAQQTGGGTGTAGVVLILVLAAALVAAAGLMRRPYGVPVGVALQALTIAGWAITPMLGVVGVLFALVWAAMLWMRQEFRRRQAAGTLPSQRQPGPRA